MSDEHVGGNFKRRDLLQLGLSAGVLVWMGGITKFIIREASLVRPPGALPPEDFYSACTKCQKCFDVCQTQAIQSVKEWEDIANAGTPQLNFLSGSCNFCMECANVCPSGALQPVTAESIRLGTAVVLPGTCGAYYNTGCSQCVGSCARQAIGLDGKNRPVVNGAKCNGCGECVQSCPDSSCGRQNARGQCVESCPEFPRGRRSACGSVKKGIFIEPVF